MDLYEILGIPRTSSDEEIKKAYRAKAREHHPDMHVGDAEKAKHAEIFKRIVEAFEILNDPQKRSRYDVQGYHGRTKPTSKPEGKRPKTKEDFEKEEQERKRKEDPFKETMLHEPMNINCSFYGGEGSGRSILVHVKLTPQELKHGCVKSTNIKKRTFCMLCGGDGSGIFPCKRCGNHKLNKHVCGECDGRGLFEGKCPRCNGSGMYSWIVEEVTFKVSPNTQPGHSITLLGQGETAARKPPGNVRVVVV